MAPGGADASGFRSILPRAGWLSQQKYIFSQFQESQVQVQQGPALGQGLTSWLASPSHCGLCLVQALQCLSFYHHKSYLIPEGPAHMTSFNPPHRHLSEYRYAGVRTSTHEGQAFGLASKMLLGMVTNI